MDENHRRALRSNLLVVERDLHYIRSQLESRVNKSVSYFTRNDIGPETKRKVLTMTKTMLDEIEQIVEKFSLESKEESVRRNILGALSEIWTILPDSRPEKLKAYGSMSGRDRELLTPHIQRLQRTLDDVFEVLR
jgi:hypothetical protein